MTHCRLGGVGAPWRRDEDPRGSRRGRRRSRRRSRRPSTARPPPTRPRTGYAPSPAARPSWSTSAARALPLVGPWGLGGGGIAVALPGAVRAGDLARACGPTEVEFSGTNVQEEGVDEPDLTKTDGSTLFVASGGRLSAVDVRARRPRLVDSLPLAEGWAHELLLHGKRLLVLSQGSPRPLPGEGRLGIRAPWPYPSRTTVTEVDVSDPARLRVVRSLELEGGYLTARLVGRAARIVLSSPMGPDLPFVSPSATNGDSARATERNRAVVEAAGARRWLPGYTIRGRTGVATARGTLVDCRSVRRPLRFSGLGLVSVVTVDLERGLDPIDTDAILSDGRTVYASRTSLYVATERWDARPDGSRPLPRDVDGDPPLRHREPDADALPRERHRRRRAPEPVVALRARRRPAGREHRAAPLVGRPAHGERDRGDDPRRPRRSPRPARSRRRPRQGRAGLRRALRRRHRVRRHVPPGRPALHPRPLRARAGRSSAAS